VGKVVTGVTASLALIEQAVDEKADAVLVHHGYFWRSESAPIVGAKRTRIKTLLENDISLLAYHLPLDGHGEFGNNVQLANQLGIHVDGRFSTGGKIDIGFVGRPPQPMTASGFAAHIEKVLRRRPLVIGDQNSMINQLAWCTGGAQHYLDRVLDLGVDAYISGEISEQTVHTARENGVVYFAAGHHATERYGVQALGEHLVEHFGIAHTFIDIENPV